MTQTQQKSLIAIIFIALIAGLIVSSNVDDQDTQTGVAVISGKALYCLNAKNKDEPSRTFSLAFKMAWRIGRKLHKIKKMKLTTTPQNWLILLNR
jgi:hypothetical protein